jgi:hypothetical protein
MHELSTDGPAVGRLQVCANLGQSGFWSTKINCADLKGGIEIRFTEFVKRQREVWNRGPFRQSERVKLRLLMATLPIS